MAGLRLGDMQRLRWSDIKPIGDGWAVSIVQHKTGSPVTVPLNGLAISLLPPRPENDDENVFHLPKESGRVTKYVRRIRDKAGITGKELTYHCSRHTPATLAISAGAELGGQSDQGGIRLVRTSCPFTVYVLEIRRNIDH